MANNLAFAFSLSLLLLSCCWTALVETAEENNNSTMTVKNARPIVGVLLMGSWDHKSQFQSVSSSYVKWAESGGARVVFIPLARSRAFYTALFDQINGVIMPGGGAPLVGSLYADAADIVLQTAEAKYRDGIYWPVWTVCLSFEKLFAYYTGNSLAWMSYCQGLRYLSLPLNFPADLNLSKVRMLKDAPSSIVEHLKSRNVTANFHSMCLDVETFKDTANLTDHFRLVSTNHYLNENGEKREFVSTVEHRIYPIYGVQWHPEKAAFEWSPSLSGFAHDEAAILVGQYFANFFIGEARKNGQVFASVEEEQKKLVYAHSAKLVYSPKDYYQEEYVFPLWSEASGAGGDGRSVNWLLILFFGLLVEFLQGLLH